MKASQKRVMAASYAALAMAIVIAFTAWDKTPGQWAPEFRGLAMVLLFGSAGLASTFPFDDDKEDA